MRHCTQTDRDTYTHIHTQLSKHAEAHTQTNGVSTVTGLTGNWGNRPFEADTGRNGMQW